MPMLPNLPGFSAERGLLAGGGTSSPGRAARTLPADASLRPAQGDGPCAVRTSAACRRCWSDCISGCAANVRECFPDCRLDCGGQPRDSPAGAGGGAGAPSAPLLSYGNYCGPGFGDPTGATPPVDAVDAVCRAHDLCYGATSYFNCGCDRALLATMPSAIAATPSAGGKAAGAVAIGYFSQAPCTCVVCLTPIGPCLPLPAGIGGLGPC
jgi:hypothetical protein